MGLTALYPGTFDPITNGHIDIIERATKMVDKLVLGVAINEAKGPLFNLDERVEMVRHETKHLQQNAEIEVVPFKGLLIHFAEEVGASIMIRGLRAVADFEYEFQMVSMNRKMNPDIEIAFLMADPQHQAVASRLVKEIAQLGGDIHHFVTPHIEKLLKEKF